MVQHQLLRSPTMLHVKQIIENGIDTSRAIPTVSKWLLQIPQLLMPGYRAACRLKCKSCSVYGLIGKFEKVYEGLKQAILEADYPFTHGPVTAGAIPRSHVELRSASECSKVQVGREVCSNRPWPLLVDLRCGRKQVQVCEV